MTLNAFGVLVEREVESLSWHIECVALQKVRVTRK